MVSIIGLEYATPHVLLQLGFSGVNPIHPRVLPTTNRNWDFPKFS